MQWMCTIMFRNFFPVTSQRAIGDNQEIKGKGKGEGKVKDKGAEGGAHSPGRMGAENMRRRNRTNRPLTTSRRSRT